ncbi:MAG: Gfo/Idh/MocA family protein [Caldimicrobium thiodismutans]
MEKLKIALVGVGHLGRFHAEKLCQIPQAELIYLIDIQEERLFEVAKNLKEKFGKTVRLERDFKKALSEVDAFVVATPTTTHYEIAKEILLSERPLFLEKPIADSLSRAEELIKISEEKKIPLQVGYIERYQKAVKRLLERVKSPLFIEAHRLSSFAERNLDIDVVLDLMIHDLDLVCLLKKGVEIDLIHAVGAPLFSDKPDIVSARIIYRDGTTCNLTASRISLSKQRKFRVFEKGGYYRVDTIEKSFLEIKPQPEKRDFSIEREVFPEDDPLREELSSFVTSVLEKKEVSPSGKEALLPLKIAFKVKEEVEKNLRRIF